MAEPVPLFQLYGDDAGVNELDAIHVERIAVRSGLYNWEIRPHRHSELCQVMWVTEGGGVLQVDGREEPFAAPRLMVLPAGVVHGFGWRPRSDGHVLMIAGALLAHLAPPEEQTLARRVLSVTPPQALCGALEAAFGTLQAEFARPGAGRRAGLHGGVLTILSLISRSAAQADREARPVSAEADLVARFRSLVEAGHREHLSLSEYGERLGVTLARLTRACRAAAGRTPLEIVHDRVMLEAKRSLAYTSLSIAETAYALGFTDPAYFSRFFQKREGMSPQVFRAGRGS